MAIYDIDKIKKWYDDFNECKGSYVNSYYQKYKSSYISTNGDSSVVVMRKNLDNYYTRIKKAYSNVGRQWKNLYKDLTNTDEALAGGKSLGAINSAGVVSKINSMPELSECNMELDVNSTNGLIGGLSLVNGVGLENTQIQTDMSSFQPEVSEISQTSEINTNGAIKTLSMIGTGAATGAAIASIIPGVGTLVGAGIGAAVGAVIGTGIVSKIKSWAANAVNSVKESVSYVKSTVKDTINDMKSSTSLSNKFSTFINGTVKVEKKLVATRATISLSAIEGLTKLVEDAVDLVALAGTCFASISTGTLDLTNYIESKITGDESRKTTYTNQMWQKCRSFVSKDFVGSVFDKFYDNTTAGQWIKTNALGFDITRSVTKEVTEVLGVIALSTVTGGSAAVIYGSAKAAEHTEENWQDSNMSTGLGFLKGSLQGGLDGAFFNIGLKGDKVFKSALNSAGKTVSKKAALLGVKTVFEGGIAVAQNITNIGSDFIFSKNSIIDESGDTITFNNLREKWNYYYSRAGGTKSIVISALTATTLSLFSDSIIAFKKTASAPTTSMIESTAENSTKPKMIELTAEDSTKTSLGEKIKSKVTKLKVDAEINAKITKNSIKGKALNLKEKLNNRMSQFIIDRRTTVEGVDVSLKGKLKRDFAKLKIDTKIVKNDIKNSIKDFPENARNKINNIKQNIDDINLKESIKNNAKESASNLKYKIKDSNAIKKVSESLDNVKSKAEYVNLYKKLNKFVKNTGIDLDSYRTLRKNSKAYKSLIECADDISEIRTIEKNLGIKSYFKNIDEVTDGINLTDMDEEALRGRYLELIEKMKKVNGKNLSKEAIDNVNTIKNVDEALSKLDEIEKKFNYSKDISINSVSNVPKSEKALTVYTGQIDDSIEEVVISDFSKLRVALRVIASGVAATIAVETISKNNEDKLSDETDKKVNKVKDKSNTIASSETNYEKTNNLKNNTSDNSYDINKTLGANDIDTNVTDNISNINEDVDTNEMLDTKDNISSGNVFEKNNDNELYDNIIIGNKVNNHNVSIGHDSAYEAVSSTNEENLISEYVNGNSIFKRFAVVNEDGSVGAITDAKGLTLLEFCEKNNVDLNKVAIDVANKDGVSLAWVTVNELIRNEINV